MKPFIEDDVAQHAVPPAEAHAPGPPAYAGIGRHLDSVSQPVQTDCTPAELRTMFDRIAANWRSLGVSEPYWSVLTNPIYLNDSFEAHAEEFFAHGRHDVLRFLAALRRSGFTDTAFDRALDFGCGVGRLSIALAPLAQSVIGVDVSAPHLAEATKTMAMHGIDNVELVRIDTPDQIDALGDFDLIVSRLVLQHNPPPVMAALYGKLLARLRPGGFAVVQMPTFIADYRFDVAEYLESENSVMEMNALPQHEVFRIIAAQGCRTLEVREDDHLGELDGLSHLFTVFRPSA